jgi:hypothetical protein
MCEGCDKLCMKCESTMDTCEKCGCLCHCDQTCVICDCVGCKHGNNEESNEQSSK